MKIKLFRLKAVKLFLVFLSQYAFFRRQIEKQCQIQQAKYSNGQIKNIVELTKIKNGGKISTQSLLDTIRETEPEISQEDLKRFKLDKEAFYRR